MQKVVILKSNLFHRGGAEKYTFRLANDFTQKGCDVTILTTGEESYRDNSLYILKDVKIINFGNLSSFGFLRIPEYDKKCIKWLKNHPTADIVFGMDRNSFQTHYRACNGVHAAYLKRRTEWESTLKSISFRFNPLHQMILHYERRCYENPQLQKLFTNSKMVKQEVLENYKVDESKIEVLHNKVEWKEMEIDFAQWESKRFELFQKYQLNSGQFQFLFVGNGYRRKGLAPLLEGLSRFKEWDFQLSVVGKDKSQEIKAFQVLAMRLGLKEKVKFFGPRNDITSFYQLADALVIPSLYDPFANVTVEALAMGLFVISSKSNGGSEVLSSTNGAIIEDVFDPDAMVKALQEAFKHPKDSSQAQKIRNSVKHLDFSLGICPPSIRQVLTYAS